MNVFRAIALALFAFPMLGFLNSYTSPAYTDDPALCSLSYPDACDPEIAAALESFPYWNYRSSAAGGGTHFILGTSNEYLWGITCNHCGASQQEWPFAGQVFDSVGFDDQIGSGAFRQFGNGENQPAGGFAHVGDHLYRLAPKPGETLPNIPFMRLLPRLDMLKDGTLIVSIGNGSTGTHPTLGWFKECATSVDGGMPTVQEGGRPNCCATEPTQRWVGADNYGPSGSNPNSEVPDGVCNLPNLHDPYHATHPGRPVCWGGEGDLVECTNTGLEYLGPTWTTDTFHWGTSEFSTSSVQNRTWFPDGQEYLRYARDIFTGSAPAGYCVSHLNFPDMSSPTYVERVPPLNRINSHMMCGALVGGGGVTKTASPGDSGSADFAYIDGTWYFLAMGQSPASGALTTIPERNRSDWASWIYGTTQDQDADGVHDFSDNCVNFANGDPLVAPFNQIDSDGDGFGNVCDGDFDQDGIVVLSDYSIFLGCFGSTDPACQIADLDGDGNILSSDLGIFFGLFGQPVGPSGLACADQTAVPQISLKVAGVPCP